MENRKVRLIDIIDALIEGKDIFLEYVNTVQDLMSQPVQKVTLDNKIGDALAVMSDYKIRHLAVIDVDEKSGKEDFIGVVSMRDVLRQVPRGWGTMMQAESDREGLSAPVVAIVRRQPKSAKPDDEIFPLIAAMVDEKIECVPVLSEAGQIVGMLTSSDIIRTFLRITFVSRVTQPQQRRSSRLIDLKAGMGGMLTVSTIIEMHFRCVENVMTENILTLRPEEDLSRAMLLMQKHRVRHIPIVDDEKGLIGLVSDRDILKTLPPVQNETLSRSGEKEKFREKLFAVEEKEQALQTELRQVMTGRSKLVTVKKGEALSECIRLLCEHRVSCLPVVNNDGKKLELIGLVTTSDFMRAFAVLGKLVGKD